MKCTCKMNPTTLKLKTFILRLKMPLYNNQISDPIQNTKEVNRW